MPGGWSVLSHQPPVVQTFRSALYAAQDPLRNSVKATSTFARSARAIASQFFSHLSSVFHEYRCFGLWKSLFATYG